MLVAVTGASGFLGRYITDECLGLGYQVRAWSRSRSTGTTFAPSQIQWTTGSLGQPETFHELVKNADAVIHAAFAKHQGNWSTPHMEPGDYRSYLETNLLGTLQLIETARLAGVKRFINISSAAVYGRILSDRLLDETHPLWPSSSYGACKASIEAFVASIAQEYQWPVCSLRPPGIYGIASKIEESKFYGVVRRVLHDEVIDNPKGAKQVHASDVARAASLLLRLPELQIVGEAFNCFDRYISDDQVAEIAAQLTGRIANVDGRAAPNKHEIDTHKIRSLGMSFRGESLLRSTIKALIDSIDNSRVQ